MKIPTYLNEFVKDYQEEECEKMTICSSADNEYLEVWYYGDLFKVEGEQQLYIVDTDTAPLKIVAKDVATGEEIVVFDGAKHGYDNMFCNEYSAEQIENRPLKRYEINASKLILELEYGIDYEDEKEQYDFDEEGRVILIDGRSMLWEDVKVNGFDWLTLSYCDAKGDIVQFVNYELA